MHKNGNSDEKDQWILIWGEFLLGTKQLSALKQHFNI
jgi:hypothetical protein